MVKCSTERGLLALCPWDYAVAAQALLTLRALCHPQDGSTALTISRAGATVGIWVHHPQALTDLSM